ncbi:hypothetical protein GCM10027613_02550 [Microlunatus endophyticus]|uniref:HAD family hydrolase n=1 Tax=Microlunatus endophyticus TaxID=1716077 RepID=UPI00166C6D33|nr:HAD-IIB family hydrolase [Microlunatus endophyticus]
MSVELVAFDLDGTILEADGSVAPECAAMIKKASASGIACVTASGRSVDFQTRLLTRSGLMSCFDALICDERWVFLNTADGDRHAAGRDDGAETLTPLQPWNTEVRDRWAALDPLALQWATRMRDRAAAQGWSCEINDRDNSIARGLRSVTFSMDREVETLVDWLAPQLATGPLACNRNGRIAHIYDKGCDKGSTLQALLGQQRYQDLGPAAILAIGDGINDRPMLDGRHGFAAATVVNAEPAVKSWVRTAGGMITDGERGVGVARILADVLAS